MADMIATGPQRGTQPLGERLGGIVARMQSAALDRVAKRLTLEQRWIEDLQQYHGKYDAETQNNLKARDQSQLFMNLTMQKTDAMSARLMDLLFPTDDRNWGIQPTPVPTLTRAAQEANAAAREMQEQAKQAMEAQQAEGADPARVAEVQGLQQRADAAKQAAAELQAKIAEAKNRSELMQEEIDDQLKESQYQAQMRDVIEDGCKIGTGVCKGPVTGDRVRKGWKKVAKEATDPNAPPTAEYQLQMGGGNTPAMRWVDIWSFFPDMEARTIGESEGVYERHLMNKKRLRDLAKLPGFDKDAVRRLLQAAPMGGAPAYLADLRDIRRDQQQTTKELYHVWEYCGPLEVEDMQTLAESIGDETLAGDMAEIDPLTETNAIVWFCQGELLKFAIYPYDSGETMYSVFNLAKDEASIFGYGIPAIMRHPQKALNAAFREMMNNAGMSSGPQIAIDTASIEPANGSWEITPRKAWKIIKPLAPGSRAFDVFNIPSAQGDLASIIGIAKQFIDDVTAMPSIAQGDQGVNPIRTFGGQALQMNSANVVFRRIVKNFDDDVTTPNIRRFYDWNMQFNPREDIKGDYDVDARGSSVLLVKEMQVQALMWVAANLGAHPVFGPMLKNRNVLRSLFQAMMIPAANVVLSDDEIDATLAKAAAESEQQSTEQMEMEFRGQEMAMKVELANMESATKLKIAQLDYEKSLIMLAQQSNMKMEEIEAMIMKTREDYAFKAAVTTAEIESKERLAAAEASMTAMVGPGGGGYY